MKGWIIIAGVRRIKKKGNTKFCSKTMCTHSKWENKQTLKNEITPISKKLLGILFNLKT